MSEKIAITRTKVFKKLEKTIIFVDWAAIDSLLVNKSKELLNCSNLN